MTEQLRSNNQLLGIALAFCGSILFSTKAVFVKLAYQYEVNSVTLLLLRMLFALPFYMGIAIYHSRKKDKYQLNRKDYLAVLFLGIKQNLCVLCFYLFELKNVP